MLGLFLGDEKKNLFTFLIDYKFYNVKLSYYTHEIIYRLCTFTCAHYAQGT